MDYLGIFLMICASSFMYKVAEHEKRRGWLWGLITFAWAFVLASFISSRIIFFLTILVSMYAAMFALNILKGDE